MQCSFATLFCLLGLASAAPSPQWIVPRQENATAGATPAAAAGTTELTFTGAGASVKVTAARDGSIFQTPGISVDIIAQTGSGTCTFKGVDGAQLTVLGANTGATFAPPQTIVSGSCT